MESVLEMHIRGFCAAVAVAPRRKKLALSGIATIAIKTIALQVSDWYVLSASIT